MITTITIAGRTTAQGILTQRHADGRVTISTGTTEFTGYPVAKCLGRAAMVVLAALRARILGWKPAGKFTLGVWALPGEHHCPALGCDGGHKHPVAASDRWRLG